MIFTTLYTLAGVEGFFAYAYVQSDSWAFTLSGKRWACQHFRPTNSYGYRDYEPNFDAKKVVFVVGDSFVKGHGIEKIDDRFSNLLAEKLGTDWTVTILADGGWSAADYLGALEKHDRRPDYIVVSYFINDIETAASAVGFNKPVFRIEPNSFLKPLLAHSYTLNFVYWWWWRRDSGENNFWTWLKKAYSDDTVWQMHTRELDNIIKFAKSSGTSIGFILWPNLTDVNGSSEITKKVESYLVEKGVKCLNLTDLFVGTIPAELTVNNFDSHPNTKVQKQVAEMLYKAFFIWNWASPNPGH